SGDLRSCSSLTDERFLVLGGLVSNITAVIFVSLSFCIFDYGEMCLTWLLSITSHSPLNALRISRRL
ncbi:hypothetical protein HN011_002829, partial [Eciton burchellii]